MCVLCDNWAATPYSLRPTTDISSNTGHELMLLGFYLGAMTAGQAELQPLCGEHETIMRQIADFKEKQATAEAAQAAMVPPQETVVIQQGYKDRIAKLNAPPAGPPKPIPASFTVQSGQVVQPIPPAPGIDPTFLFECPNCKKMVTNGQIHDCHYVP